MEQSHTSKLQNIINLNTRILVTIEGINNNLPKPLYPSESDDG